MITLAYFPPLWYRLMDHRVVRHYRGDLSRINMQPGARARLTARWQDRAKAPVA